MTAYHDPAWTKESRFRGALDDVFIIPLVFVTLAANKILRFTLSILMRMLDYAFPLAMQIVWLPLFAAKALGYVIVTVINGASFPYPRRSVDGGVCRSAGAGRGSDERLAIARSNKPCMMPLKAAWHGCSENAGISRRTPHCS
jgi:hypothetical protein